VPVLGGGTRMARGKRTNGGKKRRGKLITKEQKRLLWTWGHKVRIGGPVGGVSLLRIAGGEEKLWHVSFKTSHDGARSRNDARAFTSGRQENRQGIGRKKKKRKERAKRGRGRQRDAPAPRIKRRLRGKHGTRLRLGGCRGGPSRMAQSKREK